jgi:hypothetical protein
MSRTVGVAVVVVLCGLVCAPAWGTTPGWECVPTTAGQAVTSGGTGAGPSCASGTTPVLAPTFVSSGVGGKPTAVFTSVNVQIVDGEGQTMSTNGEGNVVLGYAENPGEQTGSHDLILGEGQAYSGAGDIVGGENNDVSGDWDLVGGDGNAVSGTGASVAGGQFNLAADPFSVVVGGCGNVAGHGAPSSSACGPVGDEAILGGHLDTASTRFASAGGPAGQTGPTGARGAAGPAGARGPRGPAGKIELVTCTISKKTAGHKPTKRCTAKLVSRVVTFKTG